MPLVDREPPAGTRGFVGAIRSTHSAERHVSEQLRRNGCGQFHRAELSPEALADGAPGQACGYSARAVMTIAKGVDADPLSDAPHRSPALAVSAHGGTTARS